MHIRYSPDLVFKFTYINIHIVYKVHAGIYKYKKKTQQSTAVAITQQWNFTGQLNFRPYALYLQHCLHILLL